MVYHYMLIIITVLTRAQTAFFLGLFLNIDEGARNLLLLERCLLFWTTSFLLLVARIGSRAFNEGKPL